MMTVRQLRDRLNRLGELGHGNVPIKVSDGTGEYDIPSTGIYRESSRVRIDLMTEPDQEETVEQEAFFDRPDDSLFRPLRFDGQG